MDVEMLLESVNQSPVALFLVYSTMRVVNRGTLPEHLSKTLRTMLRSFSYSGLQAPRLTYQECGTEATETKGIEEGALAAVDLRGAGMRRIDDKGGGPDARMRCRRLGYYVR